MLISVYDSYGQMFEVSPELAKTLVVEHGWEMTKPVISVASLDESTVAEPRAEPVVEVLVVSASEPAPVPTPEPVPAPAPGPSAL
jgi:hypothetical protein